MRPLPYHAKAFLDGLLEAAAYGHHFAHTLHAGAYLAGHPVELRKVPARNLAHYIVKGRLEERRSDLRHGILQVEQPVSQAELRRHESKRIACRLGCKG